MKKEFYLNIFLFPVPLLELKLSSRKKHVFQIIKYFIFRNKIFGVNPLASFGLAPVITNFVSKVYVPLPTVSLAPI